MTTSVVSYMILHVAIDILRNMSIVTGCTIDILRNMSIVQKCTIDILRNMSIATFVL